MVKSLRLVTFILAVFALSVLSLPLLAQITINDNVIIKATGSALTATGATTGVSASGSSYGVYATSTSAESGYAVYAITNAPYAVYGVSLAPLPTAQTAGVYGRGLGTGVIGASDGTGVYGSGTFTGVYGYSNSGPGVVGSANNYGVYADGNFGASGTKSAVVALPDDRVVSLYAMESPENWFEDFGSGKLKDGVATIKLDATFAQTVNTDTEYHVFLTPKGDCKGLFVTNETAAGFEVRELGSGQSNVAFDYRIVAKRKGLESLRLEDAQADRETAEAIRQQIAARPSNPPRLKLPKRQPQAAVPQPPK